MATQHEMPLNISYQSSSPVLVACREGNLRKLVQIKNKQLQPLDMGIEAAIRSGNLECVIYLFDIYFVGATVNVVDKFKQLAMEKGKFRILQYLFDTCPGSIYDIQLIADEKDDLNTLRYLHEVVIAEKKDQTENILSLWNFACANSLSCMRYIVNINAHELAKKDIIASLVFSIRYGVQSRQIFHLMENALSPIDYRYTDTICVTLTDKFDIFSGVIRKIRACCNFGGKRPRMW
jgi:hypothetical protein